MKFQIEKSRYLGVILAVTASGFGIASCSPPRIQSNDPGTSNVDAEKVIQLQVTKTHEVNQEILRIKDALAPLDSVLTDIDQFMKKHQGSAPELNADNAISKLRTLLEKAAKGFVTINADGSWDLEQDLPISIGPSAEGCDGSKLSLKGQNIEGEDQATLMIKDCSAQRDTKLAQVTLHKGSDIEFNFFPSTLLELQVNLANANLGGCHLKIKPNGETELTCKSTAVISGNVAVVLDQIKLNANAQGFAASLQFNIFKSDSEFGRGSLQIQPGSDPKITFCETKDQTCLNSLVVTPAATPSGVTSSTSIR